mmetsp:Transcript_43710/g.85761  ORF Transcript_43710/g.85761 Transcript_43710/m.85761 type:complete len:1013 (+) Transcript_43710:83-3121(+)
MATKSGIEARLTQATDDARRALLHRAPSSVRSHSWLSNLNTTCTIKSAPPRTPDVMSLLSTRCGWLTKRNEQHVWQRRWCCVVPHTFLYYFDAPPHHPDEWGSGAAGGPDDADGGGGPPGGPPGATSPVGIIDLECYSVVNRPGADDTGMVLELAGDPRSNPDLRSFYFEADDEDECVSWTNAFLCDRHTALMDEREAYRQVAESFPAQLQACADMIEEAEDRRKNAELEAYRVRSAAEEQRSAILGLLRGALERLGGQTLVGKLERKSRDAAISHGITIGSGTAEAMEVLIEHAHLLKDKNAELHLQLHDVKVEVERAKRHDEVDHLHKRLDQVQQQHSVAMKRREDRAASLEKLLQISRHEAVDAGRTLEAKQMEFGILSASTKSKLQELTQHKKILKKEVIELRARLDEATAALSVLQHKYDALDMNLGTERERHIMKDQALNALTSQMKMQERMMDMMSVTPSERGSMCEDGNGSFSPSNLASPRKFLGLQGAANGNRFLAERMRRSSMNSNEPNQPPKVVALNINGSADDRFPQEPADDDARADGNISPCLENDDNDNDIIVSDGGKDDNASVGSSSSMSELTDHHPMVSPLATGDLSAVPALDIAESGSGDEHSKSLPISEEDSPDEEAASVPDDANEKEGENPLPEDDGHLTSNLNNNSIPSPLSLARNPSPLLVVRPLDETVPPPTAEDCATFSMKVAADILYSDVVAGDNDLSLAQYGYADDHRKTVVNATAAAFTEHASARNDSHEAVSRISGNRGSYGDMRSSRKEEPPPAAIGSVLQPQPKPQKERALSSIDSPRLSLPPSAPPEERGFRAFLRRRPSFSDMSATASVGSVDGGSVATSGGTRRRLSIAQRARMEADSPRSGSFKAPKPPLIASPLERIGKALTESLDNSILGVKTIEDHMDENGDPKPNTPLKIRAQIQKKRQLKYLAQQREVAESERAAVTSLQSKNEKGTAAPVVPSLYVDTGSGSLAPTSAELDDSNTMNSSISSVGYSSNWRAAK